MLVVGLVGAGRRVGDCLDVIVEVLGEIRVVVDEVFGVVGYGLVVDGCAGGAAGVEGGEGLVGVEGGTLGEGVEGVRDDVAGDIRHSAFGIRGRLGRETGVRVGCGSRAGVKGAEEGGGGAALFDGVVGFEEDAFEGVDGGAAGFGCAQGEGVGGGRAEAVEDALGFGRFEPVEEIGEWDVGLLGDGAEVVVGVEVEVEEGFGLQPRIGVHHGDTEARRRILCERFGGHVQLFGEGRVEARRGGRMSTIRRTKGVLVRAFSQ